MMSNSNIMGSSGENAADPYLLGRGGLSSARLAFQHYTLMKRQGWQIHPEIQAVVKEKQSFRIAELAAGNGIWAFDFAQDYPNAEVVGIDISDKQFPPRSAWPENVTFDKHNLFDPVPTKYEEYFDLIHVRFLIAGIYKLDKDLLTRNILKMLKPGGYIQWDEIGMPLAWTVKTNQIVSREPPGYIKPMFELADFSEAAEWVLKLPQHFKRFGLERVRGYEVPISPITLPYESECLRWSFREVIDMAVAAGKPGAEQKKADAIEAEQKALEKGELWAYASILALGRKSL